MLRHMNKVAQQRERMEEDAMYDFEEIRKEDPEIAEAIQAEMARQNSHIELIASENWVSKAVMAAMGSPLTNKYAEGYPGKRYYGGCQCVDVAENLAIERAKKLFGCEYVNVQPHSGAQANMAVQFAMLTSGDKVMGMNLDHGGHLTHGSPVNMSGKYFEITPYGVNEEGVIDYEEVRRIAKECRPKLIIAGASAYARIIDFKKFREIADEVGAYLMVDMAHIAGLVAAGLHPSPIPYAHVTTTTTHKTLRGPRGGMILSSNEMNEKFNFNKAIFPGIQGGPLMHVIAAKAVCFKEASRYILSFLPKQCCLKALHIRFFPLRNAALPVQTYWLPVHFSFPAPEQDSPCILQAASPVYTAPITHKTLRSGLPPMPFQTAAP